MFTIFIRVLLFTGTGQSQSSIYIFNQHSLDFLQVLKSLCPKETYEKGNTFEAQACEFALISIQRFNLS